MQEQDNSNKKSIYQSRPYEEIQKINVRVSMLMTDLEDIQDELDKLQDLLEKENDQANSRLQEAKHVGK